MSIRPVKSIVSSKPTMEGAGVHLRRAFGFGGTSEFDPFLLLDDFRNDRPDEYRAGFPWHPHRGIETITYVLAGNVEHGDSLGNRGNLGSGDVQWMTAGRGIMHQEMPQGDAQGRMHGFQLWANLPSSLKMTAPRYQDIKAAEIPDVIDDDGTRVSVSSAATSGASAARSRASPPTRAISMSGCRPASAKPCRSSLSATPSLMCSKALAISTRRRSRSAC
jgi:redox-sensitive bicupin YhaK (pirin superfamily)